jgi:AMP-binding enzyme
MTKIYEIDLDRNAANFQPLTPLSFLARTAAVFPDRTAIVHGAQSWTYAAFYARTRRLASALAKAGIGRGDTVSVMLANTPAMIEAHYGVAMTGAVLNTLNTRLDAGILAFTLDHARSRRAAGNHPIRGVPGAGRPGFRLEDARRRVGRDLPQLHLRHHRRPQGRRLPPPRRLSARGRQCAHLRHGPASRLPVDAADVPLQRLVLSMDHLGGGRHPCLPAPGPRSADLRRHRTPQGDPSLRCADRDVDAAQCAGRREEAALPHGRIRHRRGTAAGVGAGGDADGGLQRHPRLWSHRNLWAGVDQRMAYGMERPPRRGAGGQEGAPGRRLSGASGPRCHRPRHDGAGAGRRHTRWAR